MKASTDKDALADRLGKIEAQLGILGTQVSPLWAAVQSKIVKDLTHPSVQFHEMDELLRRLDALTITDLERARLDYLLKERRVSTDPEVTAIERKKANVMIDIMDLVLDEAAADSPIAEVKLVGIADDVPADKGETK